MIIHTQSYAKSNPARPEHFAGQRVLVVGIGNTACDVALSLSSHASKVYQAYRHGRIIVSRYSEDGVPCDSKVPWPGLRLQDMLDHKLPWLARSITDRAMKKVMVDVAARRTTQDQDLKELRHSARDRRRLAAESIKGDWRLVPCASVAHVHPVEQERFIPALQSGQITPTRGFKAFTGAHAVLLDDGSSVEVDAVVFCTGYRLEFDMIPELEMNGTCGLPLTTVGETQAGSGVRREPHLPRLYQMIFPPRWASSLALLSWMSPLETYWCVCELASMAVAQAWAAETVKEQGLAQSVDGHRRPALLPPEAEMNAEVDRYHAWWRKEWHKEPSMHPGMVRSHSFYRFLHSMAGTGMFDKIDHPLTLRGWRLKRTDRELYMLLSKGPASSYAWRIFDTNPKRIAGCGRKAWPGARQALQEAVGVTFPLASQRANLLVRRLSEVQAGREGREATKANHVCRLTTRPEQRAFPVPKEEMRAVPDRVSTALRNTDAGSMKIIHRNEAQPTKYIDSAT